MKKFLGGLAILLCTTLCGSADAATVGFLGSINQGQPGPILGSFPRNFSLTLNYTINPGGGVTPATGAFEFPATPNTGTSNPNSHPPIMALVNGNITVANNNGPGGTDSFQFNGNTPAGQLNPTLPVNFSFTFTNPVSTISSTSVDPVNIAKLIGGQTSISFTSATVSGVGVIRGAPEPSTMIALTGLIAGGCGIGYRRRMKAREAAEAEESMAEEAC